MRIITTNGIFEVESGSSFGDGWQLKDGSIVSKSNSAPLDEWLDSVFAISYAKDGFWAKIRVANTVIIGQIYRARRTHFNLLNDVLDRNAENRENGFYYDYLVTDRDSIEVMFIEKPVGYSHDNPSVSLTNRVLEF